MNNKKDKSLVKILIITVIVILFVSFGLSFLLSGGLDFLTPGPKVFDEINEENVDEYLEIYGKPESSFGDPSDIFVEMTNKEYLNSLYDKLKVNNQDEQVFNLKEKYHFGEGIETSITMKFTKVNKTAEEAIDIIKEYNEVYKEENLPQAVFLDDFQYDIYKFDMYYNDANIDYATPILIQENSDGSPLIVNGNEYNNKPYWLGVEKHDDHYTYLMAGLRVKETGELCYIYTFPVTEKNPAELICLK